MADRVHGILGYYDGIFEGVADFMGTPHAFSLADDVDGEAPLYRLKPVSPAEFALISEYWRIWRRWEEAFYRGDVQAGLPSVLPQDGISSPCPVLTAT